MEQVNNAGFSHAPRDAITYEQAFAEIAVVARRLRRVERVARAAIDSASQYEVSWRDVSDRCADALGALALAADAVPEPPWSGVGDERRLIIGSLSVDPAARQAWFGEREVLPARQEFNLLATLATDPMKAWSKDELLERVWGFQGRGRTRTVDTHASRIRAKLVEGGAPPGEFVVSVWGVGYALIRP
jgi:DNA-binding response OmpR family regulator